MNEGTRSAIVIYFSAKGHTQHVAEKIAKLADADSLEVTARQPYTSDDLHYQNETCRANREQRDSGAHVYYNEDIPDLRAYTMVFIGYPIWWSQAPKIIWDFIADINLSEKTVIPFCTSGSSPIEPSIGALHSMSSKSSHWMRGTRFSTSTTDLEFRIWVHTILAGPSNTLS